MQSMDTWALSVDTEGKTDMGSRAEKQPVLNLVVWVVFLQKAKNTNGKVLKKADVRNVQLEVIIIEILAKAKKADVSTQETVKNKKGNQKHGKQTVNEEG